MRFFKNRPKVWRYACWVACCAFLLILQSCAPKPIPFVPQQGDRIVLLGNTFAERMQYDGYFETLLHAHFPGIELSMRNMAWSADEVALRPRPFQFNGLHEDLYAQKADVIFLAFGMNESFGGPDSLEAFSTHLSQLIDSLHAHTYNGTNKPRLVLFSPMAHENVGGLLPDGKAHNKDLKAYTHAMKQVAAQKDIDFLDLYDPTHDYMEQGDALKLTSNGIHLNDHGSKWMALLLAKRMGFALDAEMDFFEHPAQKQLRKAIIEKDKLFFYRWRAVNGEYVYGRRKEPFGVLSFPPEMATLDSMMTALDGLISQMASTHDLALGAQIKQITEDPQRIARFHQRLTPQAPVSTDAFTLPEGFEINVFASEKDFPLSKPIAFDFDEKGRLWVAISPSYPHYEPGVPPNDMLVILEDTDGDGKADTHTVFADSLYLPLGFAFAEDGVFIAEEPNLLFFKDLDGDDKADTREIVLSGFGSEDSHHATHAFLMGPDGALYFHEGIFLHSQIETPYGPVRSVDGASYRYETNTKRLSIYVNYHFYNPWGNAFDRWGVHYIGDASDGSTYYATPMTGYMPYPQKHPRTQRMTDTYVRPTAGLDILSSRHFPDSLQGYMLMSNVIGFQGIKGYQIKEEGSGYKGYEALNLVQSSDLNFRPIDLKIGPDGALYTADWYNPLIGHMQHSIRDPGRDAAHGRLYRITHKDRPLVPVLDVRNASVSELLNHLLIEEDRTRQRVRSRLWRYPANEVLPAAVAWLKSLGEQHVDFKRMRLEVLWLHQRYQVVQEDLLKEVLADTDHRARAAGVRVAFYWKEMLPKGRTLDYLVEASKDKSERVRLEAMVGLSYFAEDKALDAAVQQLNLATDDYMHYASNETIRQLKPLWMARLAKDSLYLRGQTDILRRMMRYTDSAERVRLSAREDLVFSFPRPQTTPESESSLFSIVLKAVPSKMIYDQDTLRIPMGETVRLRFENPDEMPHNVVLVQKGFVEKVGKAADAMAATDGFEKNFIPALPEVLFASPLVSPGQSFTLTFDAPKQAGEYAYVCTFPGHWSMMKGVLLVVPPHTIKSPKK
jgi:glucose/arabinose dehydrogenase/plastocyanin